MSYTDHTWTSGLVSVADANGFIRDNFRYLYSGREGYLAYGSTGQSFATSTDLVIVHSSSIYDQGGATYSGGALTIGVAGIYAISAGMDLAGSGTWTIKITVNGTMVSAGEGSAIAASTSIVRSLANGDVVRSVGHTTSGATPPGSGQLPYFGVQRVA
jgi:hypothetical protein